MDDNQFIDEVQKKYNELSDKLSKAIDGFVLNGRDEQAITNLIIGEVRDLNRQGNKSCEELGIAENWFIFLMKPNLAKMESKAMEISIKYL